MVETTTTSTSPRSSAEPQWRCPTAVGEVRVLTSTRHDGDFHLSHVPTEVLTARRRSLVDAPWAMLDEVHGVEVVAVADAVAADRQRGDVAVTDRAGLVLGVWTGDCAPLVLVAPDGRLAVAHAGWRGVAAGVVDVALRAVDPAGAGGVQGFLGPTIGPCCNEFGADDLGTVAAGLGCAPTDVTATTRWGTSSLDLPGAIERELVRHGVTLTTDRRCTREDPGLFSHRGGDRGRHVTAAWRSS
ncbi:MAG: polyphenol oxidase family protein [Desertimonas sp.]